MRTLDGDFDQRTGYLSGASRTVGATLFYDRIVGGVVARRLVAGRRVGGLESEILEQLWAAKGWVSGRDVWERLGDDARAYTTVMTVQARLVDKGLVTRVEEGRGHLYRAAGDPDELTAQATGPAAGSHYRRSTVSPAMIGWRFVLCEAKTTKSVTARDADLGAVWSGLSAGSVGRPLRMR